MVPVPPLMQALFYPRSIAIIGASSDEKRDGEGWVARLLAFGYPGQIYPVNPRSEEIAGVKAYPSVRDIPGPVDLAIFNVPRHLVPQLMADCVAKQVKAAHVYSAGFSETGKEPAQQLQTDLERVAREGRVRVVGPNCMGLYCPSGHITFSRHFPREPGAIAFVSQSGASASRLVALAGTRGVRFSKVVSYGNAVDLDAPDFLEYLASDPETKVIACYLEGVKDGRRFIEAVRACVRDKPLILLKAGVTEGGSRAAASHTAALAGSALLWQAFARQMELIPVETLEELIDMMVTFSFASKVSGRRVGIVGRGGGLGVVATDICEKAGLRVPSFSPQTQERLEKLIPEAGTSVRNPVEPDQRVRAWGRFYRVGLKLIDEDPEIDFILTHLGVDVYGGRDASVRDELEETSQALIEVSRTLRKPVAAVFNAGGHLTTINAVYEAERRCVAAGLPVYPSIEAAARALGRFLNYKEARPQMR